MKTLSSLFTLLVLLQVTLVQAQSEGSEEGNEDILLSDPYLSVLFQRGEYLVYNCIDQHWVCTGEAEYLSCIETRNESLKDKDTNLPCAPIRVFQSEKDCVAHQASLVSSATENRFCLHPDRREFEIVY